jgi:hypothetical protein
MSDFICYHCRTPESECTCDCVNCGDERQMIYETFPLCVACFGIFLANGDTPDPKNPVKMITEPVAKKRRKSRKDTLKAFMKEQGWTKADVKKILDTL